MKRERIGWGFEHQVFLSTRRLDVVLKKPHFYITNFLRDSGLGAQEVQHQIDSAKKHAEATEQVRVPQTRVFDMKQWIGRDGYVIAQKRIQKDNSVPSIREVIRKEGNEMLVYRYDRQSSNFIPSKKIIYWIDPVFLFDNAFQHLTKIPIGKINNLLIGGRKWFREQKRKFRHRN